MSMNTMVYTFAWPAPSHEYGCVGIRAAMSYRVNELQIAGTTYTQRSSAFLFLDKKLLKIELSRIESIRRPRKQRQTLLTPP